MSLFQVTTNFTTFQGWCQTNAAVSAKFLQMKKVKADSHL